MGEDRSGSPGRVSDIGPSPGLDLGVEFHPTPVKSPFDRREGRKKDLRSLDNYVGYTTEG